MHKIRTLNSFAAALLLSTVACSGNDSVPQSAEVRAATQPQVPPSAGGPAANSPGGSGRAAPSVTLAASDISPVRRGPIEEAIAITGDLRPIESVTVRARLEGDLTGVYVREGERVRTGQVLARFESSEQESNLASARADRVAAESETATAQWNLEQTTELFRAGAVAERDFKMAQQGLTTARARLAAAQARVRATSSLVSDTRVLAPTTGIISRKAIESGEHVARGAELFTLVRSNVLELAAAVPARQAGGLRVGQTVHFAADGRVFDGTVARVSPTIDPSTRSVTVYIQVPNENLSLRGGTFASGRVVSRLVSDALLVPAAAVRQAVGDGGAYVYRITGRTLDVAPVQLGIVDARSGIAEVLQGLAEGDRIVVGNVGTLGRGMQIIVAGEETPVTGRQ
ncbi:MAG: efflux RND transporter periplasmic adaptor subunit [Gemmatimonadaceae bacterium]